MGFLTLRGCFEGTPASSGGMALASRLWRVVDAVEAKRLGGALGMATSSGRHGNRRDSRDGSREICVLARVTAGRECVAKERGRRRLLGAVAMIYQASVRA